MSQVSIVDIEQAHPQIATSYTTDSGTAIPLANNLEILGGDGLSTSASGKTITIAMDNPVTVPLGGTGLATLTDGGILLGSGTGAVTVTGRPKAGQLLIGTTSGDPVLATLSGGVGISISSASGSITVNALGSVALQVDGDSGSAVPAANILTIAGGTGLTTSATGSTVTVNLDNPVAVTLGGTGLATTTINEILYSSAADTIAGLATANSGVLTTGATGIPVITALANDGELIIGSTAGVPAAATLTGGAGISITNAGNSITITNTSGGFSWEVVTDATKQLAIQTGYIGNRGTSITYTLPDTAVVGATIQITNIGAGLPIIAQNAGESINIVDSTTTVGVGGSLTGIDQFSSIELVCVVADTTWNVVDMTGNWTVV